MMCFNQACSTVVACQYGDSVVMTKRDGPKPVRRVLPGDYITTFNITTGKIFTPVTRNFKAEGSFHFVEIALAHGVHTVNVTDEHLMVVGRGDHLQLEQAKSVLVGDKMITSNGGMEVVTSTRSFILTEKWILETKEGSALLNDVQMTTICDDNFDALPKDYETAMHIWTVAHKIQQRTSRVV